MALSTVKALNDAWKNNQKGQWVPFLRIAAGTAVTLTPHTLWTATGLPGAGGNTTSGPANGRVLTSATAGALPLIDPAPGENLYLTGVRSYTSGPSASSLLLVDRISDCQIAHNEASGNFTGLTATSRLEAAGNGFDDGCMIWLEVTSGFSAASNTFNFTYTNSDGTGSRVTPNFNTLASQSAGNSVIGATGMFVPLQAGDRGVRSIESFTLVAGTGTGNFNVCLVRPLVWVPTLLIGYIERDTAIQVVRPRRIYASSCLTFIHALGSANLPTLNGFLRLASV